MVERKPVLPVEEHQDIKTDLHISDITREPEYNRRFFVSNIFSRIFSYMVGWTGSAFKLLKCNAAGNLQVSTTGTTFDNYKVQSGTAVDAYGTAKDFGVVVSTFDVTTWDNPLIIKTSLDNATYQGEIEIPANFDKQITVTARYIHFKNKSAGNNSRFQFVGYH